MKRFLTTGEVAQYFSVTVNTIKRWISEGKLRAILTPGGHYRIPREEFKRFLAQCNAIPSRKRILVVEDDPFTLRMLVDGLGILKDCEVEASRDGYEALIRIGEWRPHVLVTDIKMPRVDGKEVIRKVRSMEITRDMRILVVTAYPEEVKDLRGLVDGIFIKPIDMETLKETVKGLLGAETFKMEALWKDS